MAEQEYKPIYQFKNQERNFAYGFACGQVWGMMSVGKEIKDFMFVETVKEEIEAICKRFGYAHTIKQVCDGWYIINAIATS